MESNGIELQPVGSLPLRLEYIGLRSASPGKRNCVKNGVNDHETSPFKYQGPTPFSSLRPHLTLAGSPAVLTAQTQIERFEAVAQGTGKSGFAAGKASRVNIVVNQYTTLDERAKLTAVIERGDGKEINDYMAAMPRIGEIMVPGQPSYDLKYIYNYTKEDGSRELVIGTDRPYLSAKAATEPGNVQYLVGIIAITLDKNGRGDGVLAPAVELVIVDGKVKTKESAADPVKLTSVVAKKPKEKKSKN